MSETQLRKVLDLFNSADTARDNGQHRHAAELYEQALKITEAVADDDFLAQYRALFRRALAHQLSETERLRESLATLAPLSQVDAEAIKACCAYGNITDHIEIAQQLPVRLQTIEKAYQQAENYFRSAGEADWRSVILHTKSVLYFWRGMYTDALATGQEGWALWNDGCPKNFATTHLKHLFDICLVLRNEELAQRYLDEWERNEEKKSRVRESTLCQMQSRLARLRGQSDAAVDWARRAVQSIEIADWGATRFAAGCVMVRAFLVAGEYERARDHLARLRLLRRSESGHDRYDFQLLRSDYYLARARAVARMNIVDDEFAPAFLDDAERLPGFIVPRHELRKARGAYASALKEGRWIDEQLECAHRQQEISERLARVALIELTNGDRL